MSLFRFLSRRAPGAATAASAPGAAAAAPSAASAGVGDARFAYPSVDPGIPVHSADELLEGNAELMGRIKLAYGCDRETYERDIVRVVRRYAQFVSVLPATPNNCFNEPGGLLRMGMEIGFYALQATDAQIFEGRATISSRVEIEPRWRLATFIAGLCGEMYRTLSQVTVNDVAGCAWPAYLFPLEHWLAARKAERIYPKWTSRHDESRASGVFALPHIVERDTMQFLATGNSVVVPHMLGSISGMATYRDHNVLDDLVRRATALVIDTNLRASTERYGKITHGAHLERYLVDAMRRLMASNAAWEPNVPHSRVWFGRDGLYLVWPKALAEVVALLETERLPGIPKAPETLLEILVDAGVALPFSAQRATWLILPPESTVPYEALRLAEPAMLLASRQPQPEPLPVHLAARAGHARQATLPEPAGSAAPGAPAPGVPVAPVPDASSGRPRPPPASRTDAELPRAPDEPPDPLEPPEQWEQLPPPEAEPMPEERRTRFTLRPSLRMRTSCVRALRALVEQLNEPRQRVCRTVPGGLFLPLNELTHNNVDYRELASLGMLIPVENMRDHFVHNVEFGGEAVNGVILVARAVAGLEPDGDPVEGGSSAHP